MISWVHQTVFKQAGILALVVVGGVSVAACGEGAVNYGNMPMMNGNAPWMTSPSQASNSANAQVVDVQISDVSTSEGTEPAYIGPNGKGAADIFTIKAGTEVQLVVKNGDAMPHTFTVPQLGINLSVAPMATAKLNFTAKTSGTYSWYCAVPCGSWVMSHDGFMKGYFKVT